MSGIVGPRLSTIPSTFNNDYSFQFDGISEYAQPSIQTSTEDTSFSCWIKTTETFIYTDSRCAFGGRASLNASNYTLGRLGSVFSSPNDMKVRCFNTLGTTKLNDDEWHHIVFTHDFTTKETKAYVDGNTTPEVTVTFPALSNLFNVSIGWNGFNSTFHFKGSIDECAWFTSVLTPSDINIIYGSGIPNDISSLNPKTWYRMGDNAIYKSPQWLLPSNENKDKVSNYSMSFDGTDDYLQGTNTYSELDGLNKSTWSIWVKPTGSGVHIVFHNPRNTTVQNSQFLLWVWTGRIDFSLETTSKFIRGDASLITWDAWNHIMVCVDYTQANPDKGIIFVNGVDATTSVNLSSNPQTFETATRELWIGEDANGYQTPFKGNLDEFSIWAGTDQRANVAEIFNLGVPNDLNNLPTAPAPTTWIRMGENATFSTNWAITDQIGSNDWTSVNMDINDRVGDAPGSSGNTVSYNMVLSGRTSDVPT